MANVLDLRRRIRSVKSTRQITRAMKMVSAAKLRRAQDRALAARPYAQRIASVLASLKRRIEVLDPETGNLRHPLFAVRPEKRILLVIISGDKGFAGAFNTNILKASHQFLALCEDKEVDIEAIGRKARDQMRRRYGVATHDVVQSENPADGSPLTHHVRRRKSRIEVVGDHPGLLEKLNHRVVRELAEEIIRRYTHAEIDACYVVYNEFKSVIQQRVVTERLLPLIEPGSHVIVGATEQTAEERQYAATVAAEAGISPFAEDTSEADEEAARFGTSDVDYIYEQPAAELLNGLLPSYVAAMLFHSLAESVAAEHAARMTAMDAATNNASDMIDSLTLYMNRVRQAAITKEIIEIVSGAAAL